MEILNMIAGPLIGAVIGYVTNYIAVKMLFRPLHKVKILNFTLPFTPGIIPKRKDKLGQALGETIGNNLLTKEDLEKVLLSDNMKDAILDELLKKPKAESEVTNSIQTLLCGYFGQEQYDKSTEKMEEIIYQKLMDGIERVDVGSIIATEGDKVIKQKTQGTMLRFIVNNELISSLVEQIGVGVNDYIKDNGKDLLQPIITTELSSFVSQSPENILMAMGKTEEEIRKVIGDIYTGFISKKSESIMKQFNIAGIVEDKVNAMDVMEIEKLVLSVMKNELDAVVNLGAIIGFILGLFNLFF